MATQRLHRWQRLFRERVECQTVAIAGSECEFVELVHGPIVPAAGTGSLATATKRGVTCNHFRELISADVDGELDPSDHALLQNHVEQCPACERFAQDSWALRRSLRVTPVTTSADTQATVDVTGPLGTVSALRWVLFVIGATLVILNSQAVLFADATSQAHVGRHDGVFGTALGIGMLAVAIKPHRAIGLVPLTSTIALLMAIVAAVDLVTERASLGAEAIHVVEFAGLVCLWVISGGPARMQERIAAFTRRHRRSAVTAWPTT